MPVQSRNRNVIFFRDAKVTGAQALILSTTGNRVAFVVIEPLN